MGEALRSGVHKAMVFLWFEQPVELARPMCVIALGVSLTGTSVCWAISFVSELRL